VLNRKIRYYFNKVQGNFAEKFLALISFSGSLKGLNAIKALNAFKAAAVMPLRQPL
jgi:hypothetical protein